MSMDMSFMRGEHLQNNSDQTLVMSSFHGTKQVAESKSV